MSKRRSNGEGSIHKRKDGTWQGAVTIGYDAEGKQQRKTVYGKSQLEVRTKIDELRQQLAKGTFSITRITMRDYLKQWLSEKSRHVKPRTAELYGDYIRAHINPRIGRIELSKLKPMHIQSAVGEIADKVGVRTATSAAPSSTVPSNRLCGGNSFIPTLLRRGQPQGDPCPHDYLDTSGG